MRENNIRKSEGTLLVSFFNMEKSREETIYFDSLTTMFKKFHRVYEKNKKDGFWLFNILRYCIDNSLYATPHSKTWFYQEREVADKRENYKINNEFLYGIYIILKQYLFEKGAL